MREDLKKSLEEYEKALIRKADESATKQKTDEERRETSRAKYFNLCEEVIKPAFDDCSKILAKQGQLSSIKIHTTVADNDKASSLHPSILFYLGPDHDPHTMICFSISYDLHKQKVFIYGQKPHHSAPRGEFTLDKVSFDFVQEELVKFITGH